MSTAQNQYQAKLEAARQSLGADLFNERMLDPTIACGSTALAGINRSVVGSESS